jgi:secretion/DNA translocation related TadE-like protein
MRADDGSVTVLAAAAIAVAGVVVLAVGSVGERVVASQRAQTGADAAALAAAEELAVGASRDEACAAARVLSAANETVLIRCVARGAEAIVTVRSGKSRRSARAVVDPCLWCEGSYETVPSSRKSANSVSATGVGS